MTKDHITQTFHSKHPALDIVGNDVNYGYGTPLCAPENCTVMGITTESLSHDNKALEHGYGIRLRGQETGYEYLYWHTLPIFPVWGGDSVKRGQIVAFMGNAGMVYVGGVYVPLEKRTKSPFAGTHLHIEMYEGSGKSNPLPLINWSWEPNWTYRDYLIAMVAVLKKKVKLLTR